LGERPARDGGSSEAESTAHSGAAGLAIGEQPGDRVESFRIHGVLLVDRVMGAIPNPDVGLRKPIVREGLVLSLDWGGHKGRPYGFSIGQLIARFRRELSAGWTLHTDLVRPGDDRPQVMVMPAVGSR